MLEEEEKEKDDDNKKQQRSSIIRELTCLAEIWIEFFRVTDNGIPYEAQSEDARMCAARLENQLKSTLVINKRTTTTNHALIGKILEFTGVFHTTANNAVSATTMGMITAVQYQVFVLFFFAILFPFFIVLKTNNIWVGALVCTIALCIISLKAIWLRATGDAFDPNAKRAHIYAGNPVRMHKETIARFKRFVADNNI